MSDGLFGCAPLKQTAILEHCNYDTTACREQRSEKRIAIHTI
jgi:hypothetical protein